MWIVACIIYGVFFCFFLHSIWICVKLCSCRPCARRPQQESDRDGDGSARVARGAENRESISDASENQKRAVNINFDGFNLLLLWLWNEVTPFAFVLSHINTTHTLTSIYGTHWNELEKE